MRYVIRTALMSGCLLLGAGAIASAQITTPLDFTTHFAFQVGRAELPAGTYTIAPSSVTPNVMEVTGRGYVAVVSAGPAGAILGQSINAPIRNELIFQKIGGRYVLQQAWTESDQFGMQMYNPVLQPREEVRSSGNTVVVPATVRR